MDEELGFPGYGTPSVLIYDHLGNLVLDLIATDTDSFPIALTQFSYEFKEKEEDKCTISMASSRVELMDHIGFFVSQRLFISWGYLNGDMRIPIECVIVDTREAFNTKGYSLTLELTDNFSALNTTSNPQVSMLETGIKNLEKLQEGGQDNVNVILWKKRVEQWVEFANQPGKTITEKYAIHRALFNRTINERDKEFGMGEWNKENRIKEHTQLDKNFRDLNTSQQPGILNGLLAMIGEDPNYNWANTLPKVDPLPELFSGTGIRVSSNLAESDPETLEYIKGHTHTVVTGSNIKQVMQNTVNKLSVTPKQVTGRNGKAITYDKIRKLKSDPISEYTFKGGNGRLLEFTYDTNAKYSKDNNALSHFSIDPKTGAITRKDYLKDSTRIPERAEDPSQEVQTHLEEATIQGLVAVAGQGGNVWGYIQRTSSEHATGVSVDGTIVPVTYWGEFNGSIAGTMMQRGDVGDYRVAVDNTAMNQKKYTMPMIHVDEAKKELENELKAMKFGDGESVKATAKILGDPQAISGVNTVIKGVGKRRSGTYFLTGCIHDISPSGGFICTLEGYLVRTQSDNIAVISTKITKDEIKTTAKEIKNSKIAVNTNASTIQERGYYLPTDFKQTQYELDMFKKDKDWATKLPGQKYLVKIRNPKTHALMQFTIKVPVNPETGTARYPFEAFGQDLFYELVREKGRGPFNLYDDAMLIPIDDKGIPTGDPLYQGPVIKP